MTQIQIWTVGKLLEWTTEYLRKHDSSSPRLDAEVLLAHARQCQRIQLYTSFDDEPDEPTKTAFREMVRRRAEGTPVAYLVGSQEFYSLSFRVSPEVLIPRSETEHLVVVALDRAKQLLRVPSDPAENRKQDLTPSSTTSILSVADVGTGSGCIAISFAKHQPRAKIIACDVSPQALEIAKSNVKAHALDDRIELRQGDLLDDIPVDSKLDMVLSNPPYISEAEYDNLPKSVLEFEPKLALLAGATGQEVIERLIEQASTKLVPGGWLIFEISPMLAKGVTALLSENPQWSLERLTKDLAGHFRIVSAQRTSRL